LLHCFWPFYSLENFQFLRLLSDCEVYFIIIIILRLRYLLYCLFCVFCIKNPNELIHNDNAIINYNCKILCYPKSVVTHFLRFCFFRFECLDCMTTQRINHRLKIVRWYGTAIIKLIRKILWNLLGNCTWNFMFTIYPDLNRNLYHPAVKDKKNVFR
jgi:hypothetical protein